MGFSDEIHLDPTGSHPTLMSAVLWKERQRRALKEIQRTKMQHMQRAVQVRGMLESQPLGASQLGLEVYK